MSQITTHVLDTARGRPAAGVAVQLSFLQLDNWQLLATGTTDTDGRAGQLLPAEKILQAGTYRLHFDTGTYLRNLQQPVFYPVVEVIFVIDGSGAHYHVPLLLSPYGYSTYRGS